MKLLFTRRRHVGSWLIRMVTWSNFSHVDVIMPNGTLIGASAPDGVERVKMSSRLDKASKAIVMDIPVGSHEVAFSFLHSQLGKPYDYAGVAGIGLHRDWQEEDKWSCAELVAKALSEAGQKPFDAEFHHRITPQDLLMLNFPKVRVK
jgi:uncharacterized protein YycO